MTSHTQYPSEETAELIIAAFNGLIDPLTLDEIAEHFAKESLFLKDAAQRLMQPQAPINTQTTHS